MRHAFSAMVFEAISKISAAIICAHRESERKRDNKMKGPTHKHQHAQHREEQAAPTYQEDAKTASM